MAEIDYAEIEFDYADKRMLPELQRCAEALFSIPAGTLPMDREFGISMEYLDRPASVAVNFYVLEAHNKAAKYLPECKIKNITFSMGHDGRMKPKIILTVKEG